VTMVKLSDCHSPEVTVDWYEIVPKCLFSIQSQMAFAQTLGDSIMKLSTFEWIPLN